MISFQNQKKIKYSENTFTKDINIEILNNEKLTWYNPKNKIENYNYSFEELYQITQEICVCLCNTAHKVLNNELNINDFIVLINNINLKNLEKNY